jgi:hypothetical protein
MTKGENFEKATAEWLEDELGAKVVRLREIVKGKVADRGYECDVHAKFVSPFWRFVKSASVALIVAALLTFTSPGLLPDIEALATWVEGQWPELAGSGLFALGVLGVVLAYMGNKRSTRHVWVECKDRKTSIKRVDVVKLAAAVEDAGEIEEPKWVPSATYFVSTSGFDHDALEMAQAKGITCFKSKDGVFSKLRS